MKLKFLYTFILLFFITLNFSQATVRNLTTAITSSQIDVSIQTATAQGRVIEISSGGYSLSEAISSVAILPVVFRSKIDGWNYDIVVLEMNFEQGQAFLKMASKFSIPESPNSESIYFATDKIAFSSKNGFKGDMKILPETLSSAHIDEISHESIELLNGKSEFLEIAIPGFGNRLKMGLNDDSKMTFSCGAFEKFVFSGYLKSYNTVIQENSQGLRINEGKPYTIAFAEVGITDWQDMYFNATVANAFHAQAYSDLGFSFESSNTVTVDLSKRQNPNNLPKCANLSGDNWKGIYIENFDIRLPKFFKLKSGANLPTYKGKNLFIDPTGLVGNMVADKVFSLSEGTTNGQNPMDMSLDKITVDYSCNGTISGLFIGQIGLDFCDNSGEKFKNDYVFSYTEKAGYLYSLKETNSNRIKATNTISFPNGSSLSLNINNGYLDIQEKYHSSPIITSDIHNNSICKNYSGNISVSNCNDFIEWSTGGSANTVEITPLETQSYTVKCFDKYCINATVKPIEIVVYDKLNAPTLESTKDEEPYCATNEAILTNIESCPGIIEWLIDNDTWKALDGNSKTNKIYEPDINQNTTHTYATRCKLNTCYSEASNMITLKLLKSPKKPSVESSPGDYTVCQTKWLNASECTNGNYRWYKDGDLIQNTNSQVVVNQEGTYKYNVKCVDAITGCESEFYGDIYFKIERCHCAPSSTMELQFSHQDKTLKEDESFTFGAKECSSGDVHWYNGTGQIAVGNKLIRSEKAGTYTYAMKCINSDGCESSITYTQLITVLDRCANNFKPSIPVYENAIPAAETTEQDIQILMGCESGSTIYWYDSEKEEIQNGGNFRISNIPSNQNKAIYIYTRCKNAAGCFSDFKIDGFRINSVGGTNPCDNTLAPVSLSGVSNINAVNKRVISLSWDYQQCAPEVLRCEGSNDNINWYNLGDIIGINKKWPGIDNVNNNYFDPGEKFWFRVRSNNNGKLSEPSEVALITIIGSTDPCSEDDKSSNWVNQNDDKCINNVSYITEKDINPCSDSFGELRTTTKGGIGCPQTPKVPVISANKLELCGEQDIVTLTASNCNGIVKWSNDKTGISINVGAPSDYAAVCVNANGEESNNSNIVKIQSGSIPNAPLITTDKSSYCGIDARLFGIGCKTTYEWSTGETGAAIFVKNGTYKAKCINSCGKSVESNIIKIELGYKPTIPVITSNKTIVSGNQIAILTATNCNGLVNWSNNFVGKQVSVGAGTYSARCDSECDVSSSSNSITITKMP